MPKRKAVNDASEGTEGATKMAAARTKPRQTRQPSDTRDVSFELYTDTVKRLEHMAELKKMPYQEMLEQFVRERLYEEEKRMGIVRT